MKYFAYGSNMSLARLRERAPQAQRLGSWFLRAHQLRFHKIGSDGSAKCDALHTQHPDHCVIGALFEINSREKKVLDKVEGLGIGYAEKRVVVDNGGGTFISAFLYYATLVDDQLQPYCWYKQHVLAGARELSLPGHYIRAIEAVEVIEDMDKARAARQLGLHARRAGQLFL